MTKLNKPVRREFNSGRIFDRHAVIIALEPDGYLRMRIKGCRRSYSISYEALFYLLVREEKKKGKKHDQKSCR